MDPLIVNHRSRLICKRAFLLISILFILFSVHGAVYVWELLIEDSRAA